MAEKAHGSAPPPTFQGRLNLHSFALPGSTKSSPAVFPSLSSPRKRKAPSPEAEDPLRRPSPAPSPHGNKAGRARARGKKSSSGYAPPSTYAHLAPLPDAVAPDLLVLFVGLNPGLQTAATGHAYAHPTNLFWRLLHASGATPRLCRAADDRALPARHALGLTNIVARPSRSGAELSRAEMDAGVAVLEAKIRRWRPEVVCLVGKSIWESVWRVRHGRGISPAEFRYGWQDERENMGVVGAGGQREEEREDGVDYGDGGAWVGARVFVATSTSGLAATPRPPEKERIWRELGVWVEGRREEKAADTAADGHGHVV
ncbi:hypothetical protein P8C59_008080 [Phyllachora maydis]|uniref:Uracil-DNA glycosylase-like domain-containing protein n=1 Tax=Phyllachora maydis TaxID=1825666 RepID=A0AAD9MHU7_9PEZI|nr:hypothetical protein P8C59_008080 [Phyllachora maydis]